VTINKWQQKPLHFIDYLNSNETKNLIMVVESLTTRYPSPVQAHAFNALNAGKEGWLIGDGNEWFGANDSQKLNEIFSTAVHVRFYQWSAVTAGT
jgi:hypothetical protein